MIGVPEARLDQEAVELCLRQLVSTGLLHRVLRRDDHERCAHGMADAVDRDNALLHDLEQRALRLRTRAVDLVGQNDGGEDRSLVHELALCPGRRSSPP